jgi:hypothetical protein
LAWLLALTPALLAETPLPSIRPAVNGVFPHGGQQGTSVEITIRGSDLQQASEIRFATPKLHGEILKAEHNRIEARVQIDPTAEPGRHDFRLIAPHGSTLNWFDVGTRPESFDQEPNSDRDQAQPIEFPVLINGIVENEDYDYFRFEAQAGQTIAFDVNATRNGSSLDPVIGLLNHNGVEIAYSDDYYIFKDAHLVHTFRESGIYYLRLYGSGEGGSETSDYRLTAGEMPQVDHAMPMGGQRGEPVEILLSGVNLSEISGVTLGDGKARGQILSRSPQATKVRIEVPDEMPLGVHQLHIDGATLPVPFVVSEFPEVTVFGEIARQRDDPYPVNLPVVANGVIDKPRAADYFSFRVEEPQRVLLAAASMKLNYPFDPLIEVYDESGERIAYQDDPATNTGRNPANMDPHLAVDLPKAGRYVAKVRDAAFRGHPNFPYRLTVKPAEPEFKVNVIGTDETFYRGRKNIVTIWLRRLQGWNTPVEVWAENLPEGVTAEKVVVEPVNSPFRNTCGEAHAMDGTKVEIPIHVATSAPASLSQIRFRARGVMEGRTVEREGYTQYWWRVNGKIMGDAQTGTLLATIADPPALVLSTPDKVTAGPGKPGEIRVIVNRLDDGESPLEIVAETPAGITVEPATVPPSTTVATLQVTSSANDPATIVLIGKTEGKQLGKSHPIVVAPAKKPAATETSNEN